MSTPAPATPVPTPPPTVEAPRGPKILLMGDTGTGKTEAIRALCAEVDEVCALFTEPGFESVLGDIPTDKLHWHYVSPMAADWDVMIDAIKKVNTMSVSALTQLQSSDKAKFTEFQELHAKSFHFVCQRTGKDFGNVSDWPASRAFVLDSWTGACLMAMNMAAGSKAIKAQSEWGMCQDYLERYLNKITMGTKATVLVTSHPEIEQDEITGMRKVLPSTPGRKLAPKVPRYFDDVIETRRDMSKGQAVWSWSTATPNMVLKGRNLPMQDGLSPNFKLLFANWRAKTKRA